MLTYKVCFYKATIFSNCEDDRREPGIMPRGRSLKHFRPIKDFECFLANATAPGMEKEKQLAQNWIEEIHKQLAIAK